MEIRELKTFVTAAEYMNFSKAAEKLGYTQASVTLQIQHLEKELSVCLFDRIGKKVYLTDKGTLLLEHAQILIRNIESLTAKLQDNTASMETIRIGISESLLSCDFSDLIHTFESHYSNISLILKTGVRDHLSKLMMQNELDFSFIIDQNIGDPDWNGTVLGSDQAYFTAAPSHPLFQNRNLAITDLLSEKIILTEQDFGYSQALLQLLSREGISLKASLEIGNTDFIRAMLLKENCISYLPRYVIEKELSSRQLAILPLPQYSVTVYRQIIYRKNKYLTPAMSSLIRLIREQYGTSK